MSAVSPSDPPTDGWVAAIHASVHDHSPLGAAVVVDSRRLLTCAHLVLTAEGQILSPLWVSFPKATSRGRRLISAVDIAYEPPVKDLAVLTLDQDIPAGAEIAPVRYPKPADLVGLRWQAFGFPDGDPLGDSAGGQIGTTLALGWLRLDTTSRYLIRPGFSGGGLWSPDYQAVVGLIGQAHSNGDGRAITLNEADRCLPAHKLTLLADWSAQAAGEGALAAWGWSLEDDPEGIRHWRPRARGVSVDSERGYRFRGRVRALTEISRWLDRPVPDRHVLVVTGSPGVGKSAVLGRVVTTSDSAIRAQLPAGDNGIRVTPGSVACAVHAKAKTALDVATEIARAASARLPADPADLAPNVRQALEERDGHRFNVIIDALDEAASSAQARAIITKIVLPLVETCSDAGAQVVIGTRRSDDDGSLLAPFARAQTVIDLDDRAYFAEDDLTAYALASLQLAGDERPGNPYHDYASAEPVARRIAALSDRNFLIAGLVARDHGLHDQRASEPRQLTFDATIDATLAGYLGRVSPIAGLPAVQALTALAFAEAPGLPTRLWQLAIEAIYGKQIPATDLIRFARSTAASFLVESSTGNSAEPVFGLFHQALNDALIRARAHLADRGADERALTRALIDYGRQSQWRDAAGYVLRSLPGHAAAAGMIDELLADHAYLLYADLRRLLIAADRVNTDVASRNVHLVRLTPQAVTASSSERSALFSVTQALEQMPPGYDGNNAPYRARWAQGQPRDMFAVLEGNNEWVRALCTVTVAGRQLLASAGDDQTIRIWDPQTGQLATALHGHRSTVHALCTIIVAGRHLLASAGFDQAVRIWDPQTGQQVSELQGHQHWVMSLCPITVAGRQLLASAGYDHMVRIWDPQTGQQVTALEAKGVRTICTVTVADRQLLAITGSEQNVRIWDPQTRRQTAILKRASGWGKAQCPVTIGGRQLLAIADFDQAVRIWDPQTGRQTAVVEGRSGRIDVLCPVTVRGRQLLASAGEDRTVRIWDPTTRQQAIALQGHHGPVYALCPVTIQDRQLLASAGEDRTVRIWDLNTGKQADPRQSLQGAVSALCAVAATGRQLLASAGEDQTIRIWDPRTGQQVAVLQGHQGGVRALCAVTVAGKQRLVSAGSDRIIRIWDAQTGQQVTAFDSQQDWVSAVCPVTVAGRQLLASAGGGLIVRIWDPKSGRQIDALQGHRHSSGADRFWMDRRDWIGALCTVTIAGRQLLACAGEDQAVKICDPETGQQTTAMKGHQGEVRALCTITLAGRQLVASGSEDHSVRIWDPQTRQQVIALQGHQGAVEALCTLTVAGKQLLASGGEDQTVRIWDPATGASLLTIPVHHAVLDALWIGDSLAIGLSAGVLVIELSTAIMGT